jgi:hypothetical protein
MEPTTVMVERTTRFLGTAATAVEEVAAWSRWQRRCVMAWFLGVAVNTDQMAWFPGTVMMWTWSGRR